MTATLTARHQLQPVSRDHWSSYTTDGKRHRLIEIVGAAQVQIWRTYGPGCGAVDGWRGGNTKAALRAMGLPEDASHLDLYALPSVA